MTARMTSRKTIGLLHGQGLSRTCGFPFRPEMQSPATYPGVEGYSGEAAWFLVANQALPKTQQDLPGRVADAH